MDTGSRHNPFSHHLHAAPVGGYIFPTGQSLGAVAEQLERSCWRGELCGNHGAGKSTMLADLCRLLEDGDRRVTWWQSSDRRRWPPKGWISDIRSADVIAYDGAERLMPGMLLVIRLVTRLTGCGLIITTHWRHHFGAFIPVAPSAEALAKRFAAGAAANLSGPQWQEKIEEALSRHDGNSRQVLYELYREFEALHRAEQGTKKPAGAKPDRSCGSEIVEGQPPKTL